MSSSVISSCAVQQGLVEALEKMFSANYISDSYHSEWRRLVSPLSGTVEHTLLKSGEEPPTITFKKLLDFSVITSATSLARPPTTPEEESTMLAELKEAAQSASKIAATNMWMKEDGVARRHLLAASEDPQERFVVVKPLAIPDAGREELIKRLTKFFGQFGTISSVELQRWGTVQGAEIEFTTYDSASKCVEGRSQFSGSEEVRASFLPANSDSTRKLQVFSKPQFQILQQEIVINQQSEWAKKRIAEAETERKLGEESGVSFVSARRYTPGTLVVVRNRPAKYGWDVIKTKLTNLFPEDSHVIQLVKDQDADTFVFARSAQDVARILDAYKAAVSAEAAAPVVAAVAPADGRPARKPKTPLVTVVPSLEKASSDEEEYIRQLYPVWMSGAVSKKIGTNILHKAAGSKRGRY